PALTAQCHGGRRHHATLPTNVDHATTSTKAGSHPRNKDRSRYHVVEVTRVRHVSSDVGSFVSRPSPPRRHGGTRNDPLGGAANARPHGTARSGRPYFGAPVKRVAGEGGNGPTSGIALDSRPFSTPGMTSSRQP